MPGPRKSKQRCARRSPGDALKDAGSIPATSTKPPNAPDLIEVRGVCRWPPGTASTWTRRPSCPCGPSSTTTWPAASRTRSRRSAGSPRPGATPGSPPTPSPSAASSWPPAGSPPGRPRPPVAHPQTRWRHRSGPRDRRPAGRPVRTGPGRPARRAHSPVRARRRRTAYPGRSVTRMLTRGSVRNRSSRRSSFTVQTMIRRPPATHQLSTSGRA